MLVQVKNEGTLPAMLTWSMQDANIDAKEAAKKVDVALQVRLSDLCQARATIERRQGPKQYISWCLFGTESGYERRRSSVGRTTGWR